MSTPVTSVAPWDRHVSAEEEAAHIRAQFPGIVLWFGSATRHWWAMIRLGGGWRLIEVDRPRDMAKTLDALSEPALARGRHARRREIP